MKTAPQYVFKKILPARSRFILEHRVLNQPVLAGAATIELAIGLMREKNRGNDNVIKLQQVSWQKPLVVNEDATLYCVCRTAAANTAMEFITRVNGQPVVHAQLLAEVPEEKEQSKIAISLAAASEPGGRLLTADEIYKTFSAVGLNYGAGYQVISHIKANNRKATAWLSAGAQGKNVSEITASLLDGAFQAAYAAFIFQQHPGILYVPTRVKCIKIHRPLTEDCLALLEETGNGEQLLFNILLTTPQGELLVEIDGFEGEPVGDATPVHRQRPKYIYAGSWQILPEQIKQTPVPANGITITDANCPNWVPAKKTFGGRMLQLPENLFPVLESDLVNGEEKEKTAVSFWESVFREPGSTHCRLVIVPSFPADAGSAQVFYAAARQLFLLLKSFELAGAAIPLHVYCLVKDEKRVHLPAFRAWYAMAQSLARENPALQFTCALVNDSAGVNWPALLQQPEPNTPLLLQQEKDTWNRWEYQLDSTIEEPAAFSWPENGIYLLTGGNSQLAGKLVKYIAARKPSCFYLLGRGAETAAIQKLKTELGENGSVIEYLQADCTHLPQLREALQPILNKHGRLSGVFHCAGVLNDALLVNKTWNRFSATCSPKIEGLLHIDTCLQRIPVDFIITFSSISAVTGNGGQCDYAAANAFMDGWMLQRSQWSACGTAQTKYISINWPLLAGGNMFVPEKQLKAWQEKTGITVLAETEWLPVIETALTTGQAQVIPLAGNAEKINRFIAPSVTGLPVSGKTVAPAFGDAAEIPAYLINLIKTELKYSGELEADTPFNTLGIDSFLVLKLTRLLEKQFGKLPKTLFFQYTTVQQLSTYLAGRIHQPANTQPAVTAQAGKPEEMEQYLIGLFNRELKLALTAHDVRRSFDQFGIDSFLVLKLTRLLEKEFGTLPKTLFFQYNNLESLASYLQQKKKPAVAAVQPVPVKESVNYLVNLNGVGDGINSRKLELLLNEWGAESVMAVARATIAPGLLVLNDYTAMCCFGIAENNLLVFGYAGAAKHHSRLLQALIAYAGKQGYTLTVLAESDMQQSCELAGFRSAAFAVMQRLENAARFSLNGNAMKRLRYQVQHFSKNSVCITTEYKPGTDTGTDAEIVDLITAWCNGKKMVNPYVYQFRELLASGILPAQCRLFLTRKNDRLKNVIVISRYPAASGYLMDLEFYAESDEGEGLEFAIVEILQILKTEGCQSFSLGVTFGVNCSEEPDTDTEAAAILTDMRTSGIFNGEGNYQFKNKFRPVNQPVFLCRYHPYSPARIEDVILMIANPETETTIITASPVTSPAPIATTERDATPVRRQQLEKYGFNPFLLPAALADYDAITDSLAEQDFPGMWEWRKQAAAPAGSGTAEEKLRQIFPFRYLLLTSQGRRAESWLFRELANAGGAVPQNILFPTGIYHQVNNGLTPVEIPAQGDAAFPGNINIKELEKILNNTTPVAFVCVELACNALGGAPVSLRHLQELKNLLRGKNIPLVLDATRILDNAIAIQEQELSDDSVTGIIQKICRLTDYMTASLPKNFGVEAGAFIATNNENVFSALQQTVYAEGPGLSRTAVQQIAHAVQNLPLLVTLVKTRRQQVKELAGLLQQFNLTPVLATQAHALLLNPAKWPGFGKMAKPLPAFLAWFYEHTGIRIGRHNGGSNAGNPLHNYARLALPLGWSDARFAQARRQLEKFLAQLPLSYELEPEGKPAGMFAEMTARYRPLTPVQLKPETELPAPRVPLAQYTEDIAIIGISGQFPNAGSTEVFWEILKNGQDCIIEIPADRWDYRQQKNQKGECDTKWGGFIDDVDKFDPLFFNISPREAETMDPQERLFLQNAYHALEDAGYYPEAFAARYRQTGVFVGCVWGLYQLIGAEATLAGKPSVANSFHWGIANRVSYYMNFNGPSMAVDTACSSSLTALHLACESIIRGDAEAAIVGGVNLDIHPAKPLITNASKALSPDGRCRAFGENANGYVPGEGVVAIVIKPLNQAVADGDPIYGIIKATAVNHGGKTNNYTVPSPVAQAALMRNAINKAGIPAASVNYIEAHGTGTSLGDPIEIAGITEALNLPEGYKNHCAIGSVKSNIGHLEAAAGIAGLVKVLLQMQHRMLVPSLHAHNLNPYINFNETPLFVQQELAEWQPVYDETGHPYPRRALVSAFGAGGANGQVLLEEYTHITEQSHPPREQVILLLSAYNEDRLRNYARNMCKALKSQLPENDRLFMHRLAYTFQTGRKPLEYRLAVTGNNRQQWIEALEAFLVTPAGQLSATNQLQTLGYATGISDRKAIARLHAENDLARQMANCIENDEQETLCGWWLQGIEVNWQQLYSRYRLQKLPFIKYPFEKNRYWIAVPEKQPAQAAAVPPPALHPQQVHDSPHEYASHIDAETPWIRDHIVAGEKMLPGVTYIEMGCYALAAETGAPVNSLKNIVWADPVTLSSGNLKLQLSIQAKKDNLQYEIFSLRGEKRIVHSQGKLAANEQAVSPEPLNLQAVESRCTQLKSTEEIYAGLTAHGISHLHCFRVLHALRYNANEGLAQIRLPEALLPEFNRYLLHPSVMDGALQAAAAISQNKESGTGVPDIPFVIKALYRYRPLTPACNVYVKRLPAANAQVKKFDIFLLDQQGNVLVEIKEFSVATLQKLPAETIRPQREMPAAPEGVSLEYYRGRWMPVQPAGISETQANRVIVWAAQDDFYKQANDLFASRLCFSVTGNEPAGGWENNWEKLQLRENEVVEIIREPDPGLTGDKATWLMQECEKLLNCLQSFKKCYSENILRVNLVYPLQSIIAPYMQAFSAFGRSLGQESRLLRCRTIGYDGQTGLARTLQNLFTQTTDNTALCWQNDTLLEKRLETYPLTAEPGTTITTKAGDLFLITGGTGGLGLLLAKYLIQQQPGIILVLTGRSKNVSEKLQPLIELCASRQTTLHYYPCDIARREETESLFRFIQEKWGRLTGIFHAAGVTNDSLLNKKTTENFAAVLAPKTYGTQWLIHYCRNLHPAFFAGFSSIAAVTGNAGQIDYSVANAFIDVALEQEQTGNPSVKWISINWPLWKEGGMQIGGEMEKFIEKRTGMLPLPEEWGMQALQTLVGAGVTGILPFYGRQPVFRQYFQVATQHIELPLPQQTPPAATIPQPANEEMNAGQMREDITKEILQLVSVLLKVNPKDLKAEKDMSDYGADSTSLTEFSNLLNDKYGSDITPAVFFEFSAIQALADHLLEEYGEEMEQYYRAHYAPEKPALPNITAHDSPGTAVPAAVTASAPLEQEEKQQIPAVEDIAIIGLFGKFPESDTPEEFWTNMLAGVEMITDIPESRFNWRDYKGDIREINKMISARGGFLRDVDKFDPLFFGISPSEAEFMDPQQRVFLETVWHTIENAGYRPEDLSNTRTGVFVGLATSDYYEILHRTYPEIQAHSTTGNAHSVLPNRISFLLNLRGPSEPIDTACSSSLVAIHRAIQAMQAGDCDMALAGGVGIMLTATTFIAFSKAGMLSPDGLCKTFSNQANGYVRGEGSAAVLLKPLSKALADRDHIHAVIKGSAINHGGKAASLTAPNPNAQAELLVEAYTRSGINPATVSYIEAHGTGTPLGDPVEVNALKKAFGAMLGKEKYTGKPYIGLGSVKSHIGHLEAAAGIAGLTKMVLSLQHRQLPATLHCAEINEYIKLEGTRFFIQTSNTPWPSLTNEKGEILPRRCGVSSFGFGGVNAHIILEEYVPAENFATFGLPALFVFSAKEEEALQQSLVNMDNWLEQLMNGQLPLQPSAALFYNIAFTLQTGRSVYTYRRAIVAENFETLRTNLQKAVRQHANSDTLATNDQQVVLPPKGSPLNAAALDAIGWAWVNGESVNWPDYFDYRQAHRVPLPGYAFLREPYWIPYTLLKHPVYKPGMPVVPAGNAITVEVVPPAPLLTQHTVIEPGHILLAQHQIHQRSLLPGAACLQLTRNLLPGNVQHKWPLEFTNIKWASAVFGDTAVSLHTQLTPLSARFFKAEITHANGIRCFEAQVCCNETPPVISPFPYQDYRQQCTLTKTAAAVYQTFAEVGFSYGPVFQVIEQQYAHAQNSVSRIVLPAAAHHTDIERLILLVDGAFQAIDGIIPEGGWTKERLSVARGVDRLVILAELPETLWACVCKTGESVADGKSIKHFAIQLLGDDGRVYVHIENFHVQALVARNTAVQKNQSTGVAITPAPSGSGLKQQALAHFTNRLAEALRLPPGRIKPKTGFESYGIDSFIINNLTSQLQQDFPNLPKTLFFEISNLEEMVDYFSLQFPEQLAALLARNEIAEPVLSPAVPVPPVLPEPANAEPVATQFVHELLARELRLPATRIKMKDDFEKYGIDSFMINRLVQALENKVGTIPKTLFFEITTPAELAAWLSKTYPQAFAQEPVKTWPNTTVEAIPAATEKHTAINTVPPSNESENRNDIAIIGISGRFPQAKNMQEFWDNLAQGKDCITPIPAERWDNNRYFDNDKEKPGKIYTQWGGFVDGVEKFDALFFSIAPREAETLDPNERLFLRTVWEAVEDAGYSADDWRFSRTDTQVGVYVGVMWGFYGYFGLQEAEKQNYISANSPFFSIPNRVSYYFDWQGPSLAIDSACSSSLSAIHLACESLRSNECQVAVAGGVNLTIHPRKYVELCQNKFLSPDGRCRAFGEGGDGYVPGEGVGAVILKPRKQAIADGDHIYGIIKATAINHGGKTNGFSVPSPKAQARLITNTLNKSGVEADTINYIEAHGTGTSLGDPIELAGLTYAFREKTTRDQYCAIGSVKSNIGHLEAAAGIAALAKTLLQMQFRQLVPSLHANTLNPNLQFEKSPFRLQRELAPWLPVQPHLPLRAGISSFGAGGSNAHLILEEYTDAYKAGDPGETYLVCLSARNNASLEKNARNLLAFLRNKEYWGAQAPAISLPNIAYTLFNGRRFFANRLAIPAASIDELENELMNFLRRKESRRIHTGKVSADKQQSDEPRTGNMAELATAWVNGDPIHISWGNYAYRRLSLPAYAFDEKRYWVPTVAENNSPAPVNLPTGNINAVPAAPAMAEKNLYRFVLRANNPLLNEHRFRNQIIKPGMADVCMIYEAAAPLFPRGAQLSIKNLLWQSPLQVNEGATATVTVQWETLLPAMKELPCTLSEDERVLFSATIMEQPPFPLPAGECPGNRIAESRKVFAAEEIYAHFKQLGMDYGTCFRGIDTLWQLQNGEVFSRVVPPPAPPEDGFGTKPFLLDAFCQSLIGISATGELSPFAGIPLGLNQFTQLQPDWHQKSGFWVHARLQQGEKLNPKATRAVFDLLVMDDEGVPVLRFDGLLIHFPKTALVLPPENLPAVYTVEWREKLPEEQRNPGNVLVIAPCENEQTAALTRHFDKAGIEAAFVVNNGLYYNPATNGETGYLMNAWQKVWQQHGHCNQLVIVDNVALIPAGEESEKSSLNTLLAVTKSLIQSSGHPPVQIMYTYRSTANSLYTEMAAGLACAFAAETNHLLRIVQQEGTPDTIANGIVTELLTQSDVTDVRVINNRREVPVMVPFTLPRATLPAPRAGMNFLITGGTGKLGRLVADWLATRGVNCLLTGRSEQNTTTDEQVNTLKTRGVKAMYYPLQFDSREELEKLKQYMHAHFGPVHGIIHTAGFTSDALLETKDAATFWKVLQPKVAGTGWLDEVFAEEPLEHFLLFSSLASFFKNPGQADYATANYFMDQFAAYRNNRVKQNFRSGHTVSINWPLWKDGGMRVPEKIKQWISAKTGLAELDTDSGLQIFARLFGVTASQVIVLPGDKEKLEAFFQIQSVLPGANSTATIDRLLNDLEKREIDIDEILKQLETL